eukprot:COSAG04_NODE_1720_length_5811_cov_2.106793_3_plen_101_part_00
MTSAPATGGSWSCLGPLSNSQPQRRSAASECVRTGACRSHKAQFDRPQQMFGPFSAEKRGSSKEEGALLLPTHEGSDGLPVLPLGMLNVTAKAGDFLMIP